MVSVNEKVRFIAQRVGHGSKSVSGTCPQSPIILRKNVNPRRRSGREIHVATQTPRWLTGGRMHGSSSNMPNSLPHSGRRPFPRRATLIRIAHVSLLAVHINPEMRVKVAAGAAPAVLAEQGWRTFLVNMTMPGKPTVDSSPSRAERMPTHSKEDRKALGPSAMACLTSKDLGFQSGAFSDLLSNA